LVVAATRNEIGCATMNLLHKRFGLVLAALGVLSCASIPAVRAAVVEKDESGALCTIRLTGIVEAGDAVKFKEAIASVAKAKQINLCLKSDGGSFSEGLRIVEIINKSDRGIRTIVEKGSECLSACALIFMSGRTGDAVPKPDRVLHIRGSLGFHAPFIKPGAADYDASVVDRAHRESLRAISRFLQFYDATFFPDALIGASLRKKPNEFLFVETLNQAARWEIRLFGMSAPAGIVRNHLYRACRNYENWVVWNQDVTAPEPPLEAGNAFAPIRLNRGAYRDAFDEMGDESVFTCAVEWYQDAKGTAYLNLTFEDTDTFKEKQRGLQFTLESAVKRANDPLANIGFPFWYVYDARTKLKDLREP